MEQNENKTNPFLKGLKAFGHYIKFVFVDFFASFKYNNMKLPAILIAIPGIFIGFFLSFHIPTVKSIIPSYTRDKAGAAGEYVIEFDADAPADYNYFYKITMNNVKVEQSDKTYNLVLKRDYKTQTGTKLPKPKIISATVEGEELVVDATAPTGDGADKVVSYVAVVFAEKDEKMFPYLTVNNYELGTNINISTLGIKNLYEIRIKALPSLSDTEFIESDYSLPGYFEVTKAGSKYDQSEMKNIQYAGVYKAVSGLDDTLTSYIVELTGGNVANILVNDAENGASYSVSDNTITITARETVNIIPFNYSGMVLFVLMLLGILNIFFALSVSGKKNLGSVMKAVVTTVGMAICGIFYIIAIMATENAIKGGPENGLILQNVTTIINTNSIMSIVFIIASVVLSAAGCVLGFIFYDRKYEKVTY